MCTLNISLTLHAPQLSGSIRETFGFFDLNGDQRLDERELRYAFSSMVRHAVFSPPRVLPIVAPLSPHFIAYKPPLLALDTDIHRGAQGAVLTDDTLQALLTQFDLNRNGSFDIVCAPPSISMEMSAAPPMLRRENSACPSQ